MSTIANRDPEAQRMIKIESKNSESEESLIDTDSDSDAEKDNDVEKDSDAEKDSDIENDNAGNSNSMMKAISSCALYSCCSISMVLVNKSLASGYGHLIEGKGLNFLLVVFQAIIAVIAVEFSKKMKWVEYPSFNLNTAIQWLPVNIFFCSMLFTGMASLQHNSVPMVTIFKTITNIIVALGEFYFFDTKTDYLVLAAFGIIVFGAVAAAENDVEADFRGLFWMTANCAATAGYILYMKHATTTIKLSKFGMVFYNNLLCTIILFPVTVCNGELALFLKTKAIHTTGYAMKNSFAGFVGFFLNFASLSCVAYTGPITYAIVGSLNRIPTALIGWILFKSEINGQTWFFIGVSMCGGFLFSYAKLRK